MGIALAGLMPGQGLHAQQHADGGDFIRVTEESWKIGEVRSYTLQFDRVPFGREAIHLVNVEGEGKNRRLVFGQTLTLDLRAVGQAGFLTLHSSLQYERNRQAQSYRVESELRELPEYSTYPKPLARGARTVLDLRLQDGSSRMIWDGGGTLREIPLPPGPGAMFVDPLSMVTWERLFLGDSWKVGETRSLELLLPAGPVRFDYHLDPLTREPPIPERMSVAVSVDAKETVEIFSVPVPAFRCRMGELGLTLWVSGSGGILKYDDGRGLVVTLER